MITLKGILTDAGGNPIPRGLIELIAKRNAGEALAHAAITERADADGRYQFNLKSGEYLVYAQVSRQSDVEPVGEATISGDLEGEASLEEIMVMAEPLLPESIIEMRRTLASVRESQSTVESLSVLVVESKSSIDESEVAIKSAEKTVSDNLILSQQAAGAANSAAQVATEDASKAKTEAERSKASADAANESKSSAKAAEDNAKASEDLSKQNADKTGEDRAVVEGLAETVNTQSQQVASNASQVQTNKNSVDQSVTTVQGLTQTASNAATTANEQANVATQEANRVASLLGTKVDKVSGKGLSTNDFTTTEKDKLAGIEENATANATNAELRDRSAHTGTQNINTIEGLDLALYDSTSLAIIILAGGRLELIKDIFGNAHLFGIIPIQTYEQQGIPGCPFTGIIDAFRKSDGTFLSEKRIAIHKSVNIGGKTVSQAGKAPYVNLNFDEFKAKAAELGSGFRLLDIFDNALVNWIILGIISRGGQAPRGNTEWGRAHDAIHEIGTRVDGQVSNTRSGNGATLNGSGPDSWNHDGTAHGINDWVGNVWEWIDGLKMSGGEFVVAEYSGQPESKWLRTGRYINAGHVFSMTAPPRPVASSARWGNFGKTSNYAGHELLQRLMIEPIDCTKVLDGNFWYNTDGERSLLARALWLHGGYAGPVALSLSDPRSSRSIGFGGRLAFLQHASFSGFRIQRQGIGFPRLADLCNAKIAKKMHRKAL